MLYRQELSGLDYIEYLLNSIKRNSEAIKEFMVKIMSDGKYYVDFYFNDGEIVNYHYDYDEMKEKLCIIEFLFIVTENK